MAVGSSAGARPGSHGSCGTRQATMSHDPSLTTSAPSGAARPAARTIDSSDRVPSAQRTETSWRTARDRPG